MFYVHARMQQVFSAVQCQYELRARVHSYLNPESRCASCTRSLVNPVLSCCDNATNTGVCSGEELCDTFFQYCLRPLGETGVQCPLNDATAIDTMRFQPNTDALFDVGDTVFASENPFRFVGENWRVSPYSVTTTACILFITVVAYSIQIESACIIATRSDFTFRLL